MQQPGAGYIKPSENRPPARPPHVSQTAGTSSGSCRRAPQVSQGPDYLGRRFTSISIKGAAGGRESCEVCGRTELVLCAPACAEEISLRAARSPHGSEPPAPRRCLRQGGRRRELPGRGLSPPGLPCPRESSEAGWARRRPRLGHRAPAAAEQRDPRRPPAPLPPRPRSPAGARPPVPGTLRPR